MNFWKYVKQHPEAFVTELNQYLVSREMFDTFTQHEPKTELELAIRFFFQLSCSYGSRSKNFCIMQGYKYMPLRNLEKAPNYFGALLREQDSNLQPELFRDNSQ